MNKSECLNALCVLQLFRQSRLGYGNVQLSLHISNETVFDTKTFHYSVLLLSWVFFWFQVNYCPITPKICLFVEFQVSKFDHWRTLEVCGWKKPYVLTWFRFAIGVTFSRFRNQFAIYRLSKAYLEVCVPHLFSSIFWAEELVFRSRRCYAKILIIFISCLFSSFF